MEKHQRDEAQGTRQSPETRSRDDLKKAYRLTAFVGAAMIVTVFMNAFIVEVLKVYPDVFKEFVSAAAIDPLRYVLLGIAGVEFFVIKLINRLSLSGKFPLPAANQRSSFGRYSPEIQRLVTGVIIIYALCEIVSFYGLVLFIMGRNPYDFYTFMILSLILYSVYFPRYSQWEEWASEREKTVIVKRA